MDIATILKLAQAAETAGSALSQGPKPGTQSTEFYLTTAISLYSMFAPGIPAPYNILVPAVLGGVYTLARAAVKFAHGLGKGQNIPDLPDLSPAAVPSTSVPPPAAPSAPTTGAAAN